jgi:hypothetical protein
MRWFSTFEHRNYYVKIQGDEINNYNILVIKKGTNQIVVFHFGPRYS